MTEDRKPDEGRARSGDEGGVQVDQPRAVRTGEELDLAKLTAFVEKELGAHGTVSVEQFPGGHSNLTYCIHHGDREYVLRRPPFGSKVKSAHDMGAVIPFEVVCGSTDDVKPEVKFDITAFDSAMTDIPMGPATYKIAPKASPAKNKPGEFIVGVFILDDSMFTATSGTLTLERFDGNGAKGSFVIDGHERSRLGRGDYFGEISALTGGVPVADIRAETLLRCLSLPGPQLEAFLLERPTVMLRMLQAEARRLRDSNRWQ